MIDVTKIKYRLILVDKDGFKHNITDFIENLGWEENDRELALRISFNVKNENTKAGRISSIAKPGSLVRITATDGRNVNREIAQCFLTDWRSAVSGSKDSFEAKAYDMLYYLQRSQDNMYFPKGQTTQEIIRQIFAAWNIPLGDYRGPDVTHEKLLYKGNNISDMIMQVLDDAVKIGGIKAFVRAEKGKVNILPWGENDPIYYFDRDSSMMQDHAKSMSQLVTRVKIYGQADNEEKYKLEETVDGKLIHLGVFQKIYMRSNDTTAEKAKTAADEIFKESGDLHETITVQAPDIPFIRKGDVVFVKSGTLDRFLYVSGIRHDAELRRMTLELKKPVDK